MATNFPSSADSFTNPTSGDTLDNPPHDQQHANINDAMEAVQASLLDGAPLHIDDGNERVGIGTASPSQTLEVNGTAHVGSLATTGGTTNSRGILASHQNNINYAFVGRSEGGVTDTGNRLGWDYDDDSFNIKTGGDTRLAIDSSGNVGINDTTPSYTLDVNGDINATGDLRIGGTAIGEATSFTPSWTNLTVGNATQSAAYIVVNDLVFLQFRITFGSTTAVTGDYPRFALPVSTTAGSAGFGVCEFQGGGNNYPGQIQVSNYVYVLLMGASGTYATRVVPNQTVPFNPWSTGYVIDGTVCYRRK